MSSALSMKRILKPSASSVTGALMLAALTLATPVRADIGYVSLYPGELPSQFFGYTVHMLAGSSTLAFSASALASWSEAALSASALAPATLEGGALSYQGGVWITPQDIDPESSILTFGRYGVVGGLKLEAGQGAAVPGASLELTNFRTYTGGNRAIYATASFDGQRQTLKPIWTYSSVQGSDTVTLAHGQHALSRTYLGLKFTPEGLGYMQQAFQLDDEQVAQWAAMSDIGSLTVQASLDITHASMTVPEPSTWMLMGLGLCGVSQVRRRKAGRRVAAA